MYPVSAKEILADSLWIGAERDVASPIIIKTFEVNDVKKAILTITGLGYFEALVNGRAVCDYRFIPVASDYEPRDLSKFEYPLSDVMTHRIYCYEFDISDLVCDGENRLAVQLGGGFYKQKERTAEGLTSYSEDLKTAFVIEIEDANGERTLRSDATESWKKSEIAYSNLFVGEEHNYSEKDEKCHPVLIFSAPKAELSYAIGVPDKYIRSIIPKKVSECDGLALYDSEENVSGVVRIKTRAKNGQRITIRFAENVRDGKLDFVSTGAHYKCVSGKNQIMQDVFVSDGSQCEFEPKFVWHAFRYFTVEGETDSVEVRVIHASTPVSAEFESSSEGLNTLFDLFVRTQLNNMHGSFPSDCPHRERLGYTGDGQACSAAAMLILDSREFYRKWIRDILDCQNVKNGHVQHTAPFMGGGGGPGGWGSAIVIVPDNYYRIFGEREIIEECYAPASRFVEYLLSRSEDYLVVREEDYGWCLGEWCTLEKVELPTAFINSCYLVKNLRILEEWATVIGRYEDAAKFVEVRTRVEKSIIKSFRDEDGISFVGGTQGADAFAIFCGIAGQETAARLAAKYDALGHFDTGFLGTDILLEVLFNYGYADVAFKLLESRDCGSFLYMKDRGATTLWEDWRGYNSHCHPMFGGCARHLFTSILGLKQSAGSVGFSKVIFEPKIPKALTRVKGKIKTVHGIISVDIKNDAGKTAANISVPEGVTVERVN